MAKKVLGQANPAANTATALYTVPSGKEATISTFTAANLSSTTPANIRVAIRVAGAALANQQYQMYDITVGAKDSSFFTLGWTLAATDILSVQADTANVAFTACGAEVAATA